VESQFPKASEAKNRTSLPSRIIGDWRVILNALAAMFAGCIPERNSRSSGGYRIDSTQMLGSPDTPISSDDRDTQSKTLAARFFERYASYWLLFLLVVVLFVSWPIRNILLVWWVRGLDAYFSDGIRVLSGKPTRFSDGELVATLPDLVTGFGMFGVTVFGLSMLLLGALNSYERYTTARKRRR
jgi:hypothetical protein